MDNCGGKPINYFDGRALIRFGCADDARRAEQRFNGHPFPFNPGKAIAVHLIDGDLEESTDVQEFNICKSVLSGNCFDGLNNQEVLFKVVEEWDDFDEDVMELIAQIERIDDCLVISAVCPSANQKLVGYAKKYLSSESHLEWTEAKEYDI